MIRFNIIGTGFLDFEDKGGLAFKIENQQFRFAEISLGRSVSFSVPATDRNRMMLGFSEDPSENGDTMRSVYDCQMVYDGGQRMGVMTVTEYSGNAFKCVFYMDGAEWITALQKKKLSDCYCSFKGVLWSRINSLIDADQADPNDGNCLVKYDNGLVSDPLQWQHVPSVNVAAYITDILTNMGVPFNIAALSKDFWMVAGSMKGGTVETVTLASSATDVATVSPASQYLSVETFDLEWGYNVFGAAVGGGSQQAQGFKATKDVNITFPALVPTNFFLIKWNKKLTRCETLGGEFATGLAHAGPLANRTFNIKKGTVFFFADREAPDFGKTPFLGFKDTAAPYSVEVSIDRDDDLSLDDVWYIKYNHPDMTVFEFLKSVAVATGLELLVDGVEGIRLKQGAYGIKDGFKAAVNVVSVDNVTRRVSCWGDKNKTVRVAFDSDEYVTEPIVAVYEIDNAQIEDTAEHKTKFSEGNYGDNGVVIKDVEDQGGNVYKYVAKKWTLAKVDTAAAHPDYLQRVDTPSPVGYDDIAGNSTCVKMKMRVEEAVFFDLKPTDVWLWRGMAYVWTDADWSAGVLSLTLQKVSQQYDLTP